MPPSDRILDRSWVGIMIYDRHYPVYSTNANLIPTGLLQLQLRLMLLPHGVETEVIINPLSTTDTVLPITFGMFISFLIKLSFDDGLQLNRFLECLNFFLHRRKSYDWYKIAIYSIRFGPWWSKDIFLKACKFSPICSILFLLRI